MSHVTAINIEIKDLEALKAACDELGLSFRLGQTTWKWFGTWMDDYSRSDAAYKNGYPPDLYGTGEHAIHVLGSDYEIGVCRIPATGKLTLIYDFFGSGDVIARMVGKSCEKLRQVYGLHAAMNVARREAAKSGRMPLFGRSVKADGSLVLTITA